MQRRSLLKLGLVSTAVLGLAGAGVALLYSPAWREGRLTETGRGVLGAVARAVLAGSLPGSTEAARAALLAHLDRMDATLNTFPPATQSDIGSLLALLAFPAGRVGFAGLQEDWAIADVARIQAALQSMRVSHLAIRQQAYHALRDLTHAAYFADPGTWATLGYPGPPKIE